MNTQTPEQLLDDMNAAKNRGDYETANALWLDFVKAIAARTPEEVKRMEAERGLT